MEDYIIKTCKKCKEHKLLNCYYVHKQMKDGHLNICIDCTKKRIASREKELISNPDWYEKEKERHREKYYRLGYKELHKQTNENRYIAIKKHREKYPEKYFAKNTSSRINTKIKGNHLHHWSYNQEHYKDVIELSVKEHNKLHRFVIYDQERMMYRKLDGELLDTKEKHLAYCDYIQENKS